jgi:hypothetical protein
LAALNGFSHSKKRITFGLSLVTESEEKRFTFGLSLVTEGEEKRASPEVIRFARFARFARGGTTKIVSCRSTPQNKMAQERKGVTN